MKKGIRYILPLMVIAALSCAKESGTADETKPFGGSDAKFMVSSAAAWKTGDAISILDGSSNVMYSAQADGAQVIFSSEEGVSDKAKDVFAVYPYQTGAKRLEGGALFTIPSLQIAKEGSFFDPEAQVQAAYSSALKQETALQMRPVCSYFKFTVPKEDEVVEVTLMAGEEEYLAGDAVVTFDKKGAPQVNAVNGESTLVFRSESPMDGDYTISLLPCIVHEGLSVRLKTRDGRVAVHKVVARDSETGVESAITFRVGKVNPYTLSFNEPVWRNPPQVDLLDVQATSATVRWDSFDIHYTVRLFKGEEEIQTLDWQKATGEVANVQYPAFCFTGLEPETAYTVKVEDLEAGTVGTVEWTTIAVSEKGEFILKEDFSELTWGGDPIHVAWAMVDDEISAKPDVQVKWNEKDLSGTRLAAWQERSEGHNYLGPGYLRVGDSSAQKDAVKTPVLSDLKECATVNLSFDAAPFSSDYGAAEGTSRLGECYAEVWVVNGEQWVSAGTVELNDTPTAWTKCSMEVYNVLPTSRIAIGGAYGEKTKTSGGKQYGRIYLDNVSVELLRYEETAAVIPPEVSADKVFWSDASISWTCSGESTGYKLYVDGQLIQELDKDATSYHLTGLNSGTKYEVIVAALYNKGDEGKSNPVYITTGTVDRLTKNVSPTSLAFAIENRAGDNTTNNNPLIEVELLDGPDPASANSIFRSYVLDAQAQSPASPFFGGLVVNQSKSRAPLNVAIGCLQPDTDYWFRVRSVESYTFTNYQPSTPNEQTCTSSNGTSEFSMPIKATTPAKHTVQTNEILYEGFDDLMFQADYVNCAVGSVPAFKKAGKKVGNMDLETIRNWEGDWSFYGMRTVFASSQLAPHYAWGTQQTKDDDLFQLSAQNANGTIKGTAPGVGAKVYKFKDTTGSLAGWYSSNNTFAGQGFIELGAYYNASDSKAQVLGMIVTPELSGEGDCTLSFKGLVLQGRSCALGVWRYNAASKTWEKLQDVALHNSAGSTEAVEEWSALSESHKWYDYNVQLTIAVGDRIALVSDKNGAALVDEITIKKR